MPSPPPAKKIASKRRITSRRTAYHHGNLKEALIDAALRLIAEGGPENVSVREAAKRAGVSPGAPFRHFPNRTALMTAVAEQATRRLLEEIERELREAGSDDPLLRFRALGSAYLRWAAQNPTHFRVVSDRSLIDYDSSDSLRRDNDKLRALMEGLLNEAQRGGSLRSDDLAHIPLFGRALVYGMARMLIDGHMAQWNVGKRKIERSFETVLDLFISGLASERRRR